MATVGPRPLPLPAHLPLHPMRRRLSVAPSMLRAAIPPSVMVVMPQVPRLPWPDQLATPRAGNRHRRHQRRQQPPARLMRPTVPASARSPTNSHNHDLSVAIADDGERNGTARYLPSADLKNEVSLAARAGNAVKREHCRAAWRSLEVDQSRRSVLRYERQLEFRSPRATTRACRASCALFGTFRLVVDHSTQFVSGSFQASLIPLARTRIGGGRFCQPPLCASVGDHCVDHGVAALTAHEGDLLPVG